MIQKQDNKLKFQSEVKEETKPRINDKLAKVNDLKDIKQLRFDMDSPRFERARNNLNIEKSDLIRKKLNFYKKEVL